MPPDPSNNGFDDPLADADTDQQLGQSARLPAPTFVDPSGDAGPYIGGAIDLVWARFPAPRQVTLTLQIATPYPSPAPGVAIVVRSNTGGTTKLGRRFTIAPGPALSLRMFGKTFNVSAYCFGSLGLSSPVVVAALSEGDTNPLGDLVTQWTRVGNFPAPAAAGVGPAPGFLTGISGFLDVGAPAGAVYYLQAYDSTPDVAGVAAVASGSLGSALLSLGPLVGGANGSFSFDRSLRPSVRYSKGIVLALSGSPDVYTAPAVAATFYASVDSGT